MKILRTLSTSRLLLLLVAVAAVAVGVGAVAVAASGGSGSTPPPKPLAQALHDSLAGPSPEGVTAHITFTNNLLPTGALSGQVGSALMSGASGRLWANNNGHGRLELQSDAGDVQIVWSPTEVSIFDASSNTVYRATLPQGGQTDSQTAPTVPGVSEIESFLNELGAHADVSAAQPDNVGNQPAYTVRVSPKEHGGLFGAGELSWDAARPVPLRIGIYAKGDSSPVLALAVDDISYGAVSSSDIEIAPPDSAKVVDLSGLTTHVAGSGSDTTHQSKPIVGLDAVRNAAQFPVIAPDTLAGRARDEIRLVGQGDHAAAVASYGQGLDAIVVVERAAGSGGASALGALPEVTVNGAKAHELTTPLGTALTWRQGNVDFVVAGSVDKTTAEGAAGELG